MVELKITPKRSQYKGKLYKDDSTIRNPEIVFMGNFTNFIIDNDVLSGEFAGLTHWVRRGRTV